MTFKKGRKLINQIIITLMFTKKLDKTDLEELRKRQELIRQHQLIAQALDAQKQAYLMGRFQKYRLDVAKEYSFDLKTGRITEANPRL